MNELDLDLPVHPRTGLMAVGIVNGRPVWPVRGGDGTDDENLTEEQKAAKAQEEADAAAAALDGDGDKPLGPSGEKALEAEKVKRREAVAARRAADTKNSELQAEIERLRAGGTDDEAARARKQVVDDAIAAGTKKANERILRSEVQRLATSKLANPKLALQLLDLSQFEVDDDGNVDDEEIGDAIAALIEKEPYLAAQGRRFEGGADGGPRNEDRNKSKPPQVTEQELQKMSPEEIDTARKEGRLEKILTGS